MFQETKRKLDLLFLAKFWVLLSGESCPDWAKRLFISVNYF